MAVRHSLFVGHSPHMFEMLHPAGALFHHGAAARGAHGRVLHHLRAHGPLSPPLEGRLGRGPGGHAAEHPELLALQAAA